MKATEINLQNLLKFRPEEGKLLLSDKRMLLFSQASLASLQQLINYHFGREYLRALFSQFGYRCGTDDYDSIARQGQWDSDLDRIASGPITHMWEGIVHVEPTLVDYNFEQKTFLMKGIWRHSYEAENFQKNFGPSNTPVCHSLTGYASGWASAFFGKELIAIETACVACGDPTCLFEIRPIEDWDARAEPWIKALHATTASISSFLEAEVAERTRDLMEINKKLDEARAKSEEANRVKSQFLAKISHELRTPMNGVLGLAQILQSHSLTSDQHELLTMMIEAANQQISIITDLLDFSKLEAGKMSIDKTIFSLDKLLHSLEKNFSLLCQKKGLVFHVDRQPEIPAFLVGDSLKISQILVNFLSNAIKFTSQGYIKLRVERDGETLKFIVKDSGIGIAAESLRGLFKPFQQADSSISRNYGGTGLGLAICRELAELMGGSVSAESTVGVGTIMSVCVPFEAALQLGKVPTETVEKGFKQFNLKVLVVEDNSTNRFVAKALLEKMGCEVALAVNGEDGFQLAKFQTFDVIFMDIHMPVLDGIGASKKIREFEGTAKRKPIPIVALSADLVEATQDAARQVGFTAYLAKPIKKQELEEILSELLNLAA